jgi:hypothetical protein
LRRAAQQDPDNGTTRLNLAVAVSRDDAVNAGDDTNATREVASDKPTNASMPGLEPKWA